MLGDLPVRHACGPTIRRISNYALQQLRVLLREDEAA